MNNFFNALFFQAVFTLGKSLFLPKKEELYDIN